MGKEAAKESSKGKEEIKNISVCVGTFTDGSRASAQKRLEATKKAGYDDAKIIPKGKYIKVITGKKYQDVKDAEADAADLIEKGISGYVITL